MLVRLAALASLVLVLASLGGTAGVAAEAAGAVTRARGDAAAITAGERHALKSGEIIFVGDILVTGDNTRLEVRMIDETLITMGDDSRVRVDDFRFEPEEDVGRGVLHVVQGVFWAVSGGLRPP